MNDKTLESLQRALQVRGFTEDGSSPFGTMPLVASYLHESSIGDLLDVLVSRREKIFGSVAVVGRSAADASYRDVCLAIEAVKAALDDLLV